MSIAHASSSPAVAERVEIGGIAEFAGIVIAVAALWFAPAFADDYMLQLGFRTCVYLALAQGWNLMAGSAGLVSLGTSSFVGLGAYVVAIATIRYGLSYWSGVALALVLSVPVSLLSALISLRARHLFFGLLTLAIGQVAFVFVVSSYNLTGGDDGLVGVTLPDWLGSGPAQFRLAALVTVAACVVLLKITSSPFGAMLGAVRDNADRVASLGGNPKRFELAAFMIAGAFGALFGAVLAGVEGSVDPHLYSWVTSAMPSPSSSFRRASTASTSAATGGSRADVISSQSSSFGFIISARAIATR